MGLRSRMYRKIDIRFVALSENREKHSLRGWIMRVAPVYLRKDERNSVTIWRTCPAEQVKKSTEARVKPILNSLRMEGITTPVTKAVDLA